MMKVKDIDTYIKIDVKDIKLLNNVGPWNTTMG